MPIEHIAHTPSKVQHAQAGRAARVTQQKLERGNGVLFNHHWPQTKHHPSLTVVTTLSNLDLIYKRGVLSVHPPADGSGLKGVDAEGHASLRLQVGDEWMEHILETRSPKGYRQNLSNGIYPAFHITADVDLTHAKGLEVAAGRIAGQLTEAGAFAVTAAPNGHGVALAIAKNPDQSKFDKRINDKLAEIGGARAQLAVTEFTQAATAPLWAGVALTAAVNPFYARGLEALTYGLYQQRFGPPFGIL